MQNAAKRVISYALLAVIGFVMSLPLVWMVSTSLKDPSRVLTYPPQWLPTKPETVSLPGQGLEGEEFAAADAMLDTGQSRVAVLRYTRTGAVVRDLATGRRFVVALARLRPRERTYFRWRNYADAWKALRVDRGFLGLLRDADGFLVFYLNSLFVAVCVTAGQVLTSSLAAYAFARLRFPGRDKLFLGYLATLMVPSIVVIVPLFAAVRVMRMADTYWALILPGMFSAYGTFLLRQFFMTIPVELEEAAKMDGAGKLAVYQHVIMPLSKPALATLTTFVFLHTWNDFLWPLIVIDDLGKKTLPIGLAHFQGPYLTDWHLLMAASVMVMVPILVVFVAGQRYFVRGIVLSGLRA
jgi:multiple sugar transport system permease protein